MGFQGRARKRIPLVVLTLVAACNNAEPAGPQPLPEDIEAFLADFQEMKETLCEASGPEFTDPNGPCISAGYAPHLFPLGVGGCYEAVAVASQEWLEVYRETAECFTPLYEALVPCRLASETEAERTACRDTFEAGSRACVDNEAFEALSAELEFCGPCEQLDREFEYCR